MTPSTPAITAQVITDDSADSSEKAKKNSPKKVKSLSGLWPFIAPYKPQLALALLFLVLAASATLAIPAALKGLVDAGFSAQDLAARRSQIRLEFIGLFGVAIVLGIFTAARFYMVSWLGERVTADLRTAVYAHVLKQSPQFFETTQTGEVLSRLTTDTTLVQSVVGSSFSMGLRNAVLFIGGIGMLIVTNPTVMLTVLGILVLIVLPSAVIGRRVRKLSRSSQDRVADASAIAAEVLNAIPVVQGYTQEQREAKRFADASEAAFATAAKRNRSRSMLTAFIIVAMFGTLLFGVYQGVQSVLAGQISAGHLSQTVLYVGIVAGSVAVLAEVWGDLLRAAGATERLMELLASRSPIQQPENAIAIPQSTLTPSPFEGEGRGEGLGGISTEHIDELPPHPNPLPRGERGQDIPLPRGERGQDIPLPQGGRGQDGKPLRTGSRVVFSHVTFNYPSRPAQAALSDVSLDIEPGETIALVGPSGAGKSTVIQLLLRFYDAGQGAVSVNGVPLKQADLTSLRESIALVPQESTLFSTSAMENIRYGRPQASDEAVIAAAKAAYAHDFITALPEGYHTFLGERGVRLSGGQKQRIAIARAMLKDAPLLLLDEATSALDAESERAVQQALQEAMKGRTTIVIAHRLATVQAADRIVVLDQGRIVEQGTHTELVALGGLYSRLAAMQFTS
jgi:ATP-binding cassette, subfamily B, bacterial